jgi:hypothetical protein
MNLIRSALMQIFFGRNSSGVVADLAGDLGSTTYRWNDAAIKRILIGESATDIQIKQDGSALVVTIGGTEVFRVDTTNGITATDYADNTIPVEAIVDGGLGLTREVFNSNGTFTSGANVNRVLLFGCGGGGGGGGGGGDAGGGVAGGGGGGQGAIPTLISLPVTPSTGYAIVIGPGGEAGVAGTSGGGAGGNGTQGTSTTFGGSLVTLFGGLGGLGGEGSGAGTGQGGAARSYLTKYGLHFSASGKGSTGEAVNNGTAGDASIFAGGGAAGTSSATTGGGGGGGGAGYGTGSAGGNGANASSGNPGAAATANTGAGAGGGSGGERGGGNQPGREGGVGGSGFLWVMYVKES